jgi:hypothetical protein
MQKMKSADILEMPLAGSLFNSTLITPGRSPWPTFYLPSWRSNGLRERLASPARRSATLKTAPGVMKMQQIATRLEYRMSGLPEDVQNASFGKLRYP